MSRNVHLRDTDSGGGRAARACGKGEVRRREDELTGERERCIARGKERESENEVGRDREVGGRSEGGLVGTCRFANIQREARRLRSSIRSLVPIILSN